MSVLDRHHAIGHAVAQRLLGRRGHGARRLARPDHEHPAARGLVESFERPVDEGPDVTGPERGVEDRAGRVARGHRASFWSRRPASMSMSSVLGKQKRILVRPSSPWA